jgi:hypothetical protein
MKINYPNSSHMNTLRPKRYAFNYVYKPGNLNIPELSETEIMVTAVTSLGGGLGLLSLSLHRYLPQAQ